MTDQEARQKLFERVLSKLRDRAEEPMNQTPTAFGVARNGNLLFFDQGDGPTLARARIQFKWTRHDDRSLEYTIVRAADGEQLHLQPGPTGELDAIVETVVTIFLEQTKDTNS